MKRFLLLALAFLLLFVLPPRTQAQVRGIDVTLSPVYIDITADPGQTVNSKIRIRNNTTSPLPLTIQVQRITTDNNGQLLLNGIQQDETKDWIHFTSTKLTTQPKEWTDVPFTISVPKSAAYAYYWTISFTKEANQNAPGNAKVSGAAAVPVLLTVNKPGARFEGQIATFKTDSGFYEYLPVTFLSTFSNSGDVHIRPKGNIFIRDFLGRDVATITVNKESGSVLPGGKRTFTNEWNDSFAYYEPKMEDGKVVMDKNGQPEKELKFRFDKLLDLRIGKYTATEILIISGKDRDIPLNATTTFWVFPWKIIGGILIIIILAGIGLWNSTRSLGRGIKRLFRRT